MRYVRLLFPLIVLSIAVPAFAVCGVCAGIDNNTCTWSPGQGTRCYYEHYLCYSVCVEEGASHCGGGFTAAPFHDEFQIVSVKVEVAKAAPIKQESPAAVPPQKLKKST